MNSINYKIILATGVSVSMIILCIKVPPKDAKEILLNITSSIKECSKTMLECCMA